MPEGKLIVVATDKGSLLWFDAINERYLGETDGPVDKPIKDFVFDKSGEKIFYLYKDKSYLFDEVRFPA